MGLPRLELPPPRRLPLYAAGRSRIFRIVTSMATFQPTTEPIIAPNEVWLLNMYGDAYIIEIESSPSLVFQLVLHRVHSTLGVVYFKTYVSLTRRSSFLFVYVVLVATFRPCAYLLLCSIHCSNKTIEDLKPTQVKTQRALLSVLDNVLFVSFPDVTLFLDIMDTENTYYLEETRNVVATMVNRQR